MIATLSATRNISRRHLEVAVALELSRARALGSIVLPAILARVAVGFRTAIGFALIVAVHGRDTGQPRAASATP